MTIIALATVLATALAADAQVRGKADIVERQIGNPPTQLTAGESFVVGDVAANRGSVGAGWSVTRYYLVSGGTVLVAGARRVPAIKSRRRSRGRVRLSIPASAVAGQYSLLACVDATRRVAERNERNNCRAARGSVVVPGPGGVVGPGGAVPPPPPPVSSADSDGDGFPDSVDCAPHDPSIHPGAVDVPDPGFVDSNCDGIDGDPFNAVFVSPTGNDANPGTMSSPVRTLGVAVVAAQRESKDVYAAAGAYSEELRVASGVSVYGGYGPSWQRSLSPVTRITGATDAEGDTEGAFALGVTVPTTLQLLTIAPATPTTPGASSYGLRGVHSPALRLEHVTVAAAPGAPGAAGAAGTPGARGGNGGAGGIYLSPGKAGTSPVGHPGGAGGTGSNGTGSGAGGSGLSTTPDFLSRMGGPGGPGGQDGTPGTAGGRGNDGDFGLPILGGDGAGGTSGNGAFGAGFWLGHDGHDGLSGSDGHGGGGGGGGGGSGDGYGGGGGGGGGGAQGGGGGDGGHHGGGSFAIFLVECAGAIVSDSFLSAGDGGRGGGGGGGALGGAGGAGGAGGDGFPGTNSGGNGGRGGDGGRGDDGGGGAGGPSAAVVGLAASDTPGTVLSHGLGGAGGAGGVGAGNGGGRGADGPAADYLTDFH